MRAFRRRILGDETGQLEAFALALVIFVLILLLSGRRVLVQ